MSTLMGQHAIQDFNQIAIESSPQQALNSIQESSYGVVVNAQVEPLYLVVAEDLKEAVDMGAQSLLHPSADLPPTIIGRTESEIEDVVGAWSDELITSRCRGAIVLGEPRVIGIVPSAELKKYLDTEKAHNVVRRMWNSHAGWLITATAAASMEGGGSFLLPLASTTPATAAGRDTGGSTLAGTIDIGEITEQCAICGWPNKLAFGRRAWTLGAQLPPCDNPNLPSHEFAFIERN